MKFKKFFLIFVVSLFAIKGYTQKADSLWTLERCLQQATDQNISLQQSQLQKENAQLTLRQTRAARFPSLSANANQHFGLSKQYDNVTGGYDNFSGNQSASFSVGSSVTLFNGLNTLYSIKQSQVEIEKANFNSQSTKDQISLAVFESFLQILYAEDYVLNSRNQVQLSEKQLGLASEKQKLGMISKADFLQVRSQLASEHSTLANAENNLISQKIALMQLMELPANSVFEIVRPNIEAIVYDSLHLSSDSLYVLALAAKPEIAAALLEEKSAWFDIKIAQSGYFPHLTLNGEIGTGYSSQLKDPAFSEQIANEISPSLSLSLSIPIYQKRVARTNVARAEISVRNAELSTTLARNDLRKNIEQAVADIKASESSYRAAKEEYEAIAEVYAIVSEKFSLGLITSLEYLIQKNMLTNAETNLLQSKYNIIMNHKMLDYYTGVPLKF